MPHTSTVYLVLLLINPLVKTGKGNSFTPIPFRHSHTLEQGTAFTLPQGACPLIKKYTIRAFRWASLVCVLFTCSCVVHWEAAACDCSTAGLLRVPLAKAMQNKGMHNAEYTNSGLCFTFAGLTCAENGHWGSHLSGGKGPLYVNLNQLKVVPHVTFGYSRSCFQFVNLAVHSLLQKGG